MSEIDERNDSADDANAHHHPAVINSLQRPSSPDKSGLDSSSIDTTMWMHRGNGRCLRADDSLTSLIDISDNKNRNANHDIYEDNTEPMRETTYFNKKIHKRSERIDGNERESRSNRPIDTERQFKGRPEWQDFMGPLSGGGGSAARTRPQFPASISVSTPVPIPTSKSMLKLHNHSQSQSQMKSDKGLPKSLSQSQSQSTTLAAKKQNRQYLTIEQSKSVQTFEAKQQSNANKSITSTANVNINGNVNRSVTDLRNVSHVTKLRRKSQQAKDISNNNFHLHSHSHSPLGKNFHKGAMQGDLNFSPSAIQLGFLF